MRKNVLNLALMVSMIFMLSSCYTYTFAVGSGAKGDKEVIEKNHFLIGGLVPLEQSDPKAMAGGADNYDVTVTHTFIDGLLAGITGGIYTPTTTIVKK